jgi:hypothetical protein
MFLEEMKVYDIEFGDTEGKREFNNTEKIHNLFFKDSYKREIDKFIDGRLRYIYGLKGTGKTSLLKYLENKALENNIKTSYISYKDIKEEADVIHEFRNELATSEDKDTYTLTFWRWYLLSLIGKAFLKESAYDPSNLIYNSKVKFFRVISKLLDMISEIDLSTEDSKFSLKLPNGNLDVKWDGQTASRIRQLEQNLKTKLDQKVIIFIDELEISKLLTTYDVDSVLVKNLIRATRKINELSENLHIVLAVRSEVINSISMAGDEINKELEDFGFEIEWHRRKFDITHPLLGMYIQKIRYSMKKFILDNYQNGEVDLLIHKLDKMNNSTIWKRWFPPKFSQVDTPELILQHTWLRPRDLSRLFKTMQKYSRENNMINQSSYAEAVKKVGEDSLLEIKEELTSQYNEDIIKSIILILEKMQIIFTKEMFLEEAKKYNITEEKSIEILHNLYKFSVIGNTFIVHNNNSYNITVRFAYRNDKTLYEDRAIYVHRVIKNALGLTEFNPDLRIYHFSDEEKKKYYMNYKKNQEPISNIYDDQEEALSIKDIFADSSFRVK